MASDKLEQLTSGRRSDTCHTRSLLDNMVIETEMGRRDNKPLTDQAIDLIASRFRLLAEPTRLKILHTLGEGEFNVSEIVARTGLSQANVSKHLGALLEAGIVGRRKEGLAANYRVTDKTIFALCDVVCSRLKDELVARQKVLADL